MARLTDVDALIEKFERDKFDRVRNDYQSGFNDGMLHAEVVADNFFIVDAVPVEFIRSQIENSKGFYNSALRNLLDAWYWADAERKEEWK